jgi:hypothetical protein
MLGHHKLYHHGVPGRGVIISLHEGLERGAVSHYDVVVQVEFDDGTHGQISHRLWHAESGRCQTGDILPVRYDGSDHSKLVLDMPAIEASRHMPKESAGGEYQQPQQPVGANPGNVANVLTAVFGSGSLSMGDMIREARRDPQGLRDRIIQQAQAAGAFVTSQGTTPSGSPAAAGPEFVTPSQFPSPSEFGTPSQFPSPSEFGTPSQFPSPSEFGTPSEPDDLDTPHEEF